MIVDASVAVKWLLDEHGSAAADLVLAHGGLGTPDLLFAEVANVLWKSWRRGDFVQMPDGLARLANCFQRVTPCAQLLTSAAALAVALNHPAYDCFYLAMAIAEDEPLITADRRFFEICQGTPHESRLRALA